MSRKVANNIYSGNVIDLSPYNTSSNFFTAPADGYACLNAERIHEGSSTLTIYGAALYSSTNFVISLVDPVIDWQGSSSYVRKGMNILCSKLHSGHMAFFVPLT